MILMLGDAAVYNIDKEAVINRAMLPGLMMSNPCNSTV